MVDTKITSVKQITRALLDIAEKFSLVVRNPEQIGPKAQDFLQRLNPYLIECKQVSEWPGTQLLGHEATLYTYSLNAHSAAVLCTTKDNLKKWLHPHLPEDLVFYKNNESLFISIVHENDFYFQVDERDEAFLRSKGLI